MGDSALDIRQNGAAETIWLLEHPPLYTAGTSANENDLIAPEFPVHQTGRGGQYTYHGPGQRIAYVMLDLQKRGADVRAYVDNLESWIIAALTDFGIRGERRTGRVGIWVDMTRHGKPMGTEAKIAAIGVRIKKWVTMHGLAINVCPDLSHFGGIVPCGIRGHGVTSLADLGCDASIADIDASLQKHFDAIFTQHTEKARSHG